MVNCSLADGVDINARDIVFGVELNTGNERVMLEEIVLLEEIRASVQTVALGIKGYTELVKLNITGRGFIVYPYWIFGNTPFKDTSYK